MGLALSQSTAARSKRLELGFSGRGVGLALGKLGAAIEHYNAAIRINPKNAFYHNNAAAALAQEKDAARAVAALAKAIELDSTYRDKAKTDPNYDPIRDDPAFRKLVDAD